MYDFYKLLISSFSYRFIIFYGYYGILLWCLNVSIGDFWIFFLYRIWVHLHAFYVWFLTYFLGPVWDFIWGICCHVLISLWNLFEIHFWPTPISKLVDWNMKHGLYGFILFLPIVLYFAVFPCSWYSSMVCISFLIFAWGSKELQEMSSKSVGMKSCSMLVKLWENAKNGSWIWLEVNFSSRILRTIEAYSGGKAWEAE